MSKNPFLGIPAVDADELYKRRMRLANVLLGIAIVLFILSLAVFCMLVKFFSNCNL